MNIKKKSFLILLLIISSIFFYVRNYKIREGGWKRRAKRIFRRRGGGGSSGPSPQELAAQAAAAKKAEEERLAAEAAAAAARAADNALTIAHDYVNTSCSLSGDSWCNDMCNKKNTCDTAKTYLVDTCNDPRYHTYIQNRAVGADGNPIDPTKCESDNHPVTLNLNLAQTNCTGAGISFPSCLS